MNDDNYYDPLVSVYDYDNLQLIHNVYDGNDDDYYDAMTMITMTMIEKNN